MFCNVPLQEDLPACVGELEALTTAAVQRLNVVAASQHSARRHDRDAVPPDVVARLHSVLARAASVSAMLAVGDASRDGPSDGDGPAVIDVAPPSRIADVTDSGSVFGVVDALSRHMDAVSSRVSASAARCAELERSVNRLRAAHDDARALVSSLHGQLQDSAHVERELRDQMGVATVACKNAVGDLEDVQRKFEATARELRELQVGAPCAAMPSTMCLRLSCVSSPVVYMRAVASHAPHPLRCWYHRSVTTARCETRRARRRRRQRVCSSP